MKFFWYPDDQTDMTPSTRKRFDLGDEPTEDDFRQALAELYPQAYADDLFDIENQGDMGVDVKFAGVPLGEFRPSRY